MRAIALALCELAGEPAPATGDEASALIDRLRSQEPDDAIPIAAAVSESHELREDLDVPAYG